MSADEFESSLIEMKRRVPFQPFVVELNDGRRHVFSQPNLAIGGSGACYLSPEDELVDFTCDQVRQMLCFHDVNQ